MEIVRSENPTLENIDLIVLAAGRGSRFQNSGLNLPKPMIKIAGNPFFYWATISITKQININRIIYAVLESDIKTHKINLEIHRYFPSAELVVIPIVQNGPAVTAAISLEVINCTNPIIIVDCDQAFHEENLQSLMSQFLMNFDCMGAVGTIHSINPNHGFVKVNSENKLTFAKATMEESSTAYSGIYVFRDREIFLTSLNNFKSIRETTHECVLADVIGELIETGSQIQAWPISNHSAFGTPKEHFAAQKSQIFEMLA